MPNVHDDDKESLYFADESEWMDEDEEDDAPTYKIVRFYQDSAIERETIATGLTLDEAKEHCSDPETSSKTATSPEAVARTEQYGAWFDGWNEE